MGGKKKVYWSNAIETLVSIFKGGGVKRVTIAQGRRGIKKVKSRCYGASLSMQAKREKCLKCLN